MRSSCHCHAPSPVAMADTRGLCQNFVGQQVTTSAVGQRVSIAILGEGHPQVMGCSISFLKDSSLNALQVCSV